MFDQREKHGMFSGPIPGFDPLRSHIELTRANTCSVCSYIAKSRHGLNLHETRKHKWPRTQDYGHTHNARWQDTSYFQNTARCTETAAHRDIRWPMSAPDPFASDTRASMPVFNSVRPSFAPPNLYASAHVSAARQANSYASRAPTRTNSLIFTPEEPNSSNARPTGIWNPAFLDGCVPNPELQYGQRNPIQIEVPSPSGEMSIAHQGQISYLADPRPPRLALDEIRSGVKMDSGASKTTASNTAERLEPMFHGSSDAGHAQVPMFHARPRPATATRGRKKSMKIKDLTNTVFKTIDSGTDRHPDDFNTAVSAQTTHESRGCGSGETCAQRIHKENFTVSFEQMLVDSRGNSRFVSPVLDEVVKMEPIKAEVKNETDHSAAFTASVFGKEEATERKASETLNSQFVHGSFEHAIKVEEYSCSRLQLLETQAPTIVVDYHQGHSPLPCVKIEGNSDAAFERVTSEKQRDSALEIQPTGKCPTADIRKNSEAVANRVGSETHNAEDSAIKEDSNAVTLHIESERVPKLPKLCAVFPEEVAKLPEVSPSSRRDIKLCLDNLMQYLLAFSICEFRRVTNEVFCSHCSESFTSFSKLREHLGLAMKFLPYRCTRCGFCTVLQRKASKHCSENHKTK